MKKTAKTTDWSATRRVLTTWEKPALIALLKDLYESAPASRDFIQARCHAKDSGTVLETYRKKVIAQFFLRSIHTALGRSNSAKRARRFATIAKRPATSTVSQNY